VEKKKDRRRLPSNHVKIKTFFLSKSRLSFCQNQDFLFVEIKTFFLSKSRLSFCRNLNDLDGPQGFRLSEFAN